MTTRLARTLKEKALPPNHPDIAILLRSLALAQLAIGEGAPALTTIQKALAIDKSAYGSDSPLLWGSLDDRGEVFEFLHRYSEAEDDLRSSVDMATALVGADYPWTAYPLIALGNTFLAQGRYREAIPVLERVIEFANAPNRAPTTSPRPASPSRAHAGRSTETGQAGQAG